MSHKISFIIATVNRDAQLQQCITSIEKAHEYKPDISVEVLVVVQQAKQNKDIQIKYPDITKLYYIDRLGLSAARNYAIERCTGDYLVFIDDDAFVSEDFLNALTQTINGNPSIHAFCGRLIDPVEKIPFSCLFSNTHAKKLSRFDFQNFMGSAHILSKSVIDKVGGYDERFGVGSKYFGSEETDMFFRLKASGQQVLYVPELVFFHPIPSVPPSYVYKYSYAIAAAVTKNCLRDKTYFFVYFFIPLKAIAKASIRALQKNIFKGIYADLDKRYHYESVIKGTFDGVRGFINAEVLTKESPCQ